MTKVRQQKQLSEHRVLMVGDVALRQSDQMADRLIRRMTQWVAFKTLRILFRRVKRPVPPRAILTTRSGEQPLLLSLIARQFRHHILVLSSSRLIRSAARRKTRPMDSVAW